MPPRGQEKSHKQPHRFIKQESTVVRCFSIHHLPHFPNTYGAVSIPVALELVAALHSIFSYSMARVITTSPFLPPQRPFDHLI